VDLERFTDRVVCYVEQSIDYRVCNHFGFGTDSMPRLMITGPACAVGVALWMMLGYALAGWEELASMPTPRSEMAAVHWDGKIYVPGGLGGMRTFEVYDIAADTWRGLAPLPAGRHHLMVAAHAGRIFVFSGADDNWRATNTAWAYDPNTDRWEILAPMPEPRYAGVAVSLGGYIFAVGGDGPSGRLLRYDPVRAEWTALAATLARREHTAATSLGGKIYVMGGRFSGVGELRSVEMYDVDSGRWVYGPSLRTARGGFSAVYSSNSIYALGGEVIMHDRKTLASTEVLRLGATEWQRGPDLPVALHGVPVVAVGGVLYVLGGSESAGAIVNRGRVFRYRVPGQER
jgi:N-acetylneuraminic acid mutarotase